MRTRTLLAGVSAASLAALTACGSSSSQPATGSGDSAMPSMASMSAGMTTASSASSDGMDGMPLSSGTGLAATVDGYSLSPHTMPMAGMAMATTFTITKNGKPVTAFDAEQTKLMHLYLIRSDLTGFQHLHPTMSPDGTWSATPAALTAGRYRMYVQFAPHADAANGALVLSRPITVDGSGATSAPLPAPANTTIVDGYTLTLTGTPTAGADSELRITISKNGSPVTDLQPYLATYAHVTAIHQGDLAFAHLHPRGTTTTGDHGGPTLTVDADLPASGTYRIFVQFQTGGTLHTAALTVMAR